MTALALTGMLPFSVSAAVQPAVAHPWAPVVEALRGPELIRRRPCSQSRFTCITLRVPRDHFAADGGGGTFDVTFAIQRATRSPRKGVFVTITGGPGTSGISAADGYTDAFDPRIPRQYDVVFIDQRGVAASEPLQCPDATLAWYTADPLPTISPEQVQAYARAARQFARNCVAETGWDPALLPYFSTRQAVEDLEAIRAWLKAPKLDLYGESYGTQFVQTYAAAHPDRLHALFVDGPVDLTLTGTEYYDEDVDAFDTTLVHALRTCTPVSACLADDPRGDLVQTYDELADRLRQEPLSFDFVDAHGQHHQRTYSLGDLETAAAGYVYSNFDQMLFQRAMAWAMRGELLPLARLTYISLGQDPETLEAILDPTYSDAMYYAVECMDYAYGTGSASERAAAYLAAGEAADVAAVRLGSIFYGDLPCAYWPAHPPTEERPAYVADTPFPVFVLASTEDPATPYPGALRIYRHLKDGYLIVQPGGPHIIFGRGSPCPDDLITAYLVNGERPAHRRTTCDAVGPDPYVRIPAAGVAGYAGPREAMRRLDDQLNYDADYWSWDGLGTLAEGCLQGGTVRYHGYAKGYRVALRRCAMSSGLPLTGKATINDFAGTLRLHVHGPGGTHLRYVRAADGHRSVTGTWFGEHVGARAAA